MKKIFKKEGIIHELVREQKVKHERCGELNQPFAVGLYELRLEESGDVVGYNIHLTRLRENKFKEGEIYEAQPSSESWGRDGFSFYSRGMADRRFEELVSVEYWSRGEVLE